MDQSTKSLANGSTKGSASGSIHGSASSHSLEQPQQLTRQETQVDDSHSIMGPRLSRIETSIEENLVHRVLTGDTNKYSRAPMPEMGQDKPLPPMLASDRTAYRVEFTDNDPMCPQNWSKRRKLTTVVIFSVATTVVGFGSSVFGPMSRDIMHVYHIGPSVAALGVSLYVLGFAAGPILWGPLSEYLGRYHLLVCTMFITTCFQFATATAKDLQTLMLGRFFSGLFGAGCLALVPSVMADMYLPVPRGRVTALYAMAVNAGPPFGPIVGGFIVNSYLSYRWPIYLSGILMAAATLVVAVFCEETFHPIILKKKAAQLRARTGNWGIYAQHETLSLDIGELAHKSLVRPFQMLVREPILFLMSLYSGFVYGLLYMCLTAIPVIYEGYGFKGGVVQLPYLSMFVGNSLAALASMFYYTPRYQKLLRTTGKKVIPEARLEAMIVGAPIFTIGIFWLFWTGAYPKTAEHPHGCHWMVPTVALALFGYGFVGIFLSTVNYLVDTYLMLSASAFSANVFLRSSFGAAFPLFATQMFHNLGIQWAGTLIGCIAAVLLPVPFLFYIYGPKIRTLSRYAINLEQVEQDTKKES